MKTKQFTFEKIVTSSAPRIDSHTLHLLQFHSIRWFISVQVHLGTNRTHFLASPTSHYMSFAASVGTAPVHQALETRVVFSYKAEKTSKKKSQPYAWVASLYTSIDQMLHYLQTATANLARLSAHKPIHVTLITSLLVSIAYLAVVDEYIPSLLENNGSVSYYHPKGSSDYLKWIQIDDVAAYPDADAVSLVPLVFRRKHSHVLPNVPDTITGAHYEKILVVKSNALDSKLGSLTRITADGVTWKARSHNKVARLLEHGKLAYEKVCFLIKGAETFDIGLITVAYIAMAYTIIKVFIDLKRKDSSLWLGFSIIISSTFAFIFALAVTTKIFETKVSLLSMTEGIPFLTAIIGFKHKISIASAIISQSTSNVDVKTIVSSAIASHTTSLLRDHVTVIIALLLALLYAASMEGLRNFCLLSSTILAFDLLLTYTFLSAVFGLKIEINRARRTHDLQTALEEEGISSFVAASIANRSAKNEYPKGDSRTTVLSFKVMLLGIFFAFHGLWLGSSWLYGTSSELFNDTTSLSEIAAKQIQIGSKGTVVSILKPQVYVPNGLLVTFEDLLSTILTTISSAIKDSLISKFLLFGFAISISFNAYFLNATRYQRNATNKLVEREMSRPQLSSLAKPSRKSKKLKKKKAPTYDTDDSSSNDGALTFNASVKQLPLEECIKQFSEGKVRELNNDEVSSLVVSGKLPLYALEKQLGDNLRAVVVRRKAIAKLANAPVLDTERLPYAHYDYDRVFGACCENVIGYMPLPVGVAGPLIIDGTPYHIPMATTEGCLVASTMRGCKAINSGGGVQTILTQDGMTRGPCVSFPSLARAGACKLWLDSEDGQRSIKKAFNSTSRFARLQHVKTAIAGTLLFIRFKTTTGDAMGMNMISKGVEHSLRFMTEECGFDDMSVIAVSGNYCTDKKPAAINWIEGRGKSVVAEARIPKDVVQKVLKSDVDALVELNVSKNLVGSAMAGSVGGFNAHAANLVTAVYLACGQDPAQNVESSNCITLMNKVGDDLQISVSMPSIEVGTIGGGTILEAQGSMLDLLGVRGPHPENPGDNSRRLACIIASAVLAAELSLCSALAAGHLVQSHMQHNRSKAPGSADAAATKPVANGTTNGQDLKRLKEGSVNCIKS